MLVEAERTSQVGQDSVQPIREGLARQYKEMLTGIYGILHSEIAAVETRIQSLPELASLEARLDARMEALQARMNHVEQSVEVESLQQLLAAQTRKSEEALLAVGAQVGERLLQQQQSLEKQLEQAGARLIEEMERRRATLLAEVEQRCATTLQQMSDRTTELLAGIEAKSVDTVRDLAQEKTHLLDGAQAQLQQSLIGAFTELEEHLIAARTDLQNQATALQARIAEKQSQAETLLTQGQADLQRLASEAQTQIAQQTSAGEAHITALKAETDALRGEALAARDTTVSIASDIDRSFASIKDLGESVRTQAETATATQQAAIEEMETAMREAQNRAMEARQNREVMSREAEEVRSGLEARAQQAQSRLDEQAQQAESRLEALMRDAEATLTQRLHDSEQTTTAEIAKVQTQFDRIVRLELIMNALARAVSVIHENSAAGSAPVSSAPTPALPPRDVATVIETGASATPARASTPPPPPLPETLIPGTSAFSVLARFTHFVDIEWETVINAAKSRQERFFTKGRLQDLDLILYGDLRTRLQASGDPIVEALVNELELARQKYRLELKAAGLVRIEGKPGERVINPYRLEADPNEHVPTSDPKLDNTYADIVPGNAGYQLGDKICKPTLARFYKRTA